MLTTKIQPTKKGWKEIITKTIDVITIIDKPFIPRTKWLEFNQNNPEIGKLRSECKKCSKKWEDVTGDDVYLIVTTDGNKVICQDCFNEVKSLNLSNEKNKH